ncbi:sporulation-specific protein 6 [Aaosphaeria arxii CBS 175.79]|uniref:Sporulation-specific protein 6 n=1 Tax=Aaosphaeria arxii CBS 175.79 TaxID=1450172 RepID=A0A6A5Y8A5_9PLEO|nr:sporulation-specific protein 6 [Aaosphaeria arxii CBS 175.79]KAF2020794.1 sporulation-specific protein 6 [Aaosphaeria arxii CBS 175.79]
MSNRRVPLGNIQNATNSPLRVAAVGGKRQRSHASEQRDLPYGQPPPKKQIVEVDDAEARRYGGLTRRSGAPPTAFQKKLEAVREVKAVPKQSERSTKGAQENLETIRQWQRHYRKMFPQFVFYFESIPDDVRSKVLKQAQMLGAREVKFFSREATHVITTRPIPAEHDTNTNVTAKGTINPAQLETKKSVFDTALQKSNGDILFKAREMGLKIWSAEKLQRMLNTMFNTDTGEQPPDYTSRHGTTTSQAKAGRQADLQKLLQNEKLNGPLDRDYSASAHDMIQLRGYYIYIHDMDELTRPVMIREYSKVAKKEEGKWPQFRLSGHGKCPFVEDPHHARRQHQEQDDYKTKAAKAAAPRTRAAAALAEKRALVENNNIARRPSAGEQDSKQDDAKPLDPPKMVPSKNTDSMPPMFGSAQANIRAMPRIAGGEPVASGIQPSNITSAIRSQMISSTAAAPGARAGNSKEVNQLKRKVLEKNSVPSANSCQSSAMNDVRAALNQENAQPVRAAKRKAQDALGFIHEDATPSDEERQTRKAAAVRRRKVSEKELKPGYCENCREKFNDFDEHVVSRKHRKFALTQDNWKELDKLLACLVRQ